MAPTAPRGADPLAAGQAALANADWAAARARFAEATLAGGDARAWEGLSRAAWWLGEQEETLAARERAFRAYRREGNVRGAAGMAMWLASDNLDFRGDEAVAAAWLRQGRELLTGEPPCSELGYLTVLDADIALLSRSDPRTAASLAAEAIALSRDVADVGVEVVGLAVLGSALVASGDVEAGLQRLEECVALAVGEDFAEVAAPGWALCHTVSACADIGDYGRAEQWCRTLHGWSAVWRARHFFGICRTAYGDVLATGGDWPSAEEELLTALADLRTTRPALAGPTAIRLGRLRARQGDLIAARELFEAALPLAQAVVAIGELDLHSDAPAAADAAERALRRGGDSSVFDRFPALELLARARAASGDREGATEAATELEREATRLATPYMLGRARLVRARVLEAAGEHDAARRNAEDAVDLFTASSAPYEAADARMVLSAALDALGRHERARVEDRAAREAFALLGARGGDERASGGPLSPRETDILRLVAQGLGDAKIAERLFVSPHTVHRHIANIRTKLGVSSRAAAVAHATRSGLV